MFSNNVSNGIALDFRPVTIETLPDLERFSEQHGKFRYCSCMKWRMTSTEFSKSTKTDRISALEKLVRNAMPVGILGYHTDEPVAWCSVAPRETYKGLERYKALTRIDDAAVWSVACFFIDRRFRKQGVMTKLLEAAVDYASSNGAAIVEGYPVEPDATVYTYMGFLSAFADAGFQDVTPPNRTRRIFRWTKK